MVVSRWRRNRAKMLATLALTAPLAVIAALSVATTQSTADKGGTAPSSPKLAALAHPISAPTPERAPDPAQPRPPEQHSATIENKEAAAPDTAAPEAAAPNEAAPPNEAMLSIYGPPAVDLSDATLDEVGKYLWSVYQRSPLKWDSTGDFTWKDAAAALRMDMSLPQYVIGGMDPDLRELIYHAGRALDAAGIDWTILSGFRDDYRQGLAKGYKARVDNSLHGGSTATGGWGHGCAVDLVEVTHHSDALWHWLDANAYKTGLQRLLPGIDPGHAQPRGAWHELAALLRSERMEQGGPNAPPPDEGASAAALTAPPSDADTPCIYLRHREEDPNVAKADAGPHPRFAAAVRAKPGKRHEAVHEASKEHEAAHEGKSAPRKAAITKPHEKSHEPRRA
jgi:hypothetical protein